MNIDYVEQSDDSPRKPAGLPADAYVEKRSQCHGGHFDLLIVPVQPIGMILVGTAFDLNLYLESYLLMGAITLIGFAIGSRIIIR